MSRKSVAILDKPVASTADKKTCSHHWIIEPALGPTSTGICKLCGEKKIFMNVIEDLTPKSNLTKLFESDEFDDDSLDKEDEEEEDK